MHSALPAGSVHGFKLLAPVPEIPDKEIPPPPGPDSDDDELVAVAVAAPQDKAAKPSAVEGKDQAEATRRKRAAEEAGLDGAGEGKKAKVVGVAEEDVLTLD